MRIVITDTAFIWNPDNPALEVFKDVLLVVCLEGKAVTDQYECFVSPYKFEGNVLWRYVEPLLEDMDEWIIDIKDMNRLIYEEYTGVNNEKVMQNLFRLKEAVPVERLHIRVPNIPGFNTKEDVEKSVEWIKDVLGVEPEVFDYYVLPHIVKEPDWLHDDDEDEE